MRKLILIVGAACAVSACANSFSATYKGAGGASEALTWAKSAEVRFEELSAAATADASLSKVRVYFDAVPSELVVDGSTIGVREGVNAALVGQVHIIATVKVPTDEEAIPVMQRAALAGGADLAYCPREGLGHRCYLVRTAQQSRGEQSATSP